MGVTDQIDQNMNQAITVAPHLGQQLGDDYFEALSLFLDLTAEGTHHFVEQMREGNRAKLEPQLTRFDAGNILQVGKIGRAHV